jgi:hypothetical protein
MYDVPFPSLSFLNQGLEKPKPANLPIGVPYKDHDQPINKENDLCSELKLPDVRSTFDVNDPQSGASIWRPVGTTNWRPGTQRPTPADLPKK